MKQLFLYLRTKLMAVPGMAWVDADKGQINSYETRPAIAFPAALIKVDFPQIQNLNRTQQKRNARIIIRLVWDYSGVTDNTASDELLAQSLAYFDLVQAVEDALHSAIDVSVFNKPLELVSMQEENRRDELKVMTLVYNTVVFG